MILGVGVDIVKIERFEKISEKNSRRFFSRVFTEREREFISGKTAQSAAGIFAAKEAVAKALGTGFVGFSPQDIEILHKKNGKPHAVLHKNARKIARRAAKRARRFVVHISISHTKTDAVAYAVFSQI